MDRKSAGVCIEHFIVMDDWFAADHYLAATLTCMIDLSQITICWLSTVLITVLPTMKCTDRIIWWHKLF
jgi:hypothetical protein